MRNYLTINESTFPEALRTIPSPPKQLHVVGDELDSLLARPRAAIVGSRRITAYGRAITENIAADLARQGVVIVSGLALGVDTVAHKAAVEAGGQAIAVLPCGLDRIYPSANRQLARDIIRTGGVLISEYPDGTQSFKANCVARNRLVSGISDVLIVTESAERSGTMHTARFARLQQRPIMAVPGNITNADHRGTNLLIKHGAHILLDSSDVLEVLGITQGSHKPAIPTSENPAEHAIIQLIARGTSDGADLLRESKLPVQEFNQALTMLEITGVITNNGNNQWYFR